VQNIGTSGIWTHLASWLAALYVLGSHSSGCYFTLIVFTFFGRPFVKRFALCHRTVVLFVCLSVCPVYPVCLWRWCTVTNGWTDQDETWHAGRPRLWPHCVRWGLSSPSPNGAQPPIFGPNLLPNDCMDQHATWCGGSPQPRRLCVKWGPQLPSPKRGGTLNFRFTSIVAKRLHGPKCHLVRKATIMKHTSTWYDRVQVNLHGRNVQISRESLEMTRTRIWPRRWKLSVTAWSQTAMYSDQLTTLHFSPRE